MLYTFTFGGAFDMIIDAVKSFWAIKLDIWIRFSPLSCENYEKGTTITIWVAFDLLIRTIY